MDNKSKKLEHGNGMNDVSRRETLDGTQDDGAIDELCEALIDSFNAALKSGRIRLGLSDSLDILDYEPNSIVVCVLPYVKEINDPLKHLHLLLIEAFCQEHAIRLLKVASMEGFCVLLRLLDHLDASDPYAAWSRHFANTSNDASDLLIIKESPRTSSTDAKFKALYDVIRVNRGAGGDSALLLSPLVLPPLFPTYCDTM